MEQRRRIEEEAEREAEMKAMEQKRAALESQIRQDFSTLFVVCLFV